MIKVQHGILPRLEKGNRGKGVAHKQEGKQSMRRKGGGEEDDWEVGGLTKGRRRGNRRGRIRGLLAMRCMWVWRAVGDLERKQKMFFLSGCDCEFCM